MKRQIIVFKRSLTFILLFNDIYCNWVSFVSTLDVLCINGLVVGMCCMNKTYLLLSRLRVEIGGMLQKDLVEEPVVGFETGNLRRMSRGMPGRLGSRMEKVLHMKHRFAWRSNKYNHQDCYIIWTLSHHILIKATMLSYKIESTKKNIFKRLPGLCARPTEWVPMSHV